MQRLTREGQTNGTGRLSGSCQTAVACCLRDLLRLDNKSGGKNQVCKWLSWLLSLLLTVPPPI